MYGEPLRLMSQDTEEEADEVQAAANLSIAREVDEYVTSAIGDLESLCKKENLTITKLVNWIKQSESHVAAEQYQQRQFGIPQLKCMKNGNPAYEKRKRGQSIGDSPI